LVLFLTSSLVLMINKIPTNLPDLMDWYIFLLFFHCTMSVILVAFNFLNSNFRKNQVIKNIRSQYNELEKQYMKLPLVYSLFATVIWGLTLLGLLIIMIILDYKMWYLVVPNFLVFILMSFFMFLNSLFPMLINYTSLISDEIKDKVNNKSTQVKTGMGKKVGVIYNMLSLCIPLVSLAVLYYENIIFEYKEILVLSMYVTGFVFAIAYITRALSQRIVFTWWERFYMDIHLSDYSIEDIIKDLNENYSIANSIETIAYNNVETSQGIEQ
ncbi:hypothetical protein, partial [Paenibacillus odorifer]